jgi:hypothetical protein
MLDWLSEYCRVGLELAGALFGSRTRQEPITMGLSERGESLPSQAESPLIRELLPALAEEVWDLLMKEGEPELADQVLDLRIVDRCRCGDDFCATFYVQPKPNGAYGPSHRNITLKPAQGMLVLDLLGDRIVAIEVLYRDEIRKSLQAALP